MVKGWLEGWRRDDEKGREGEGMVRREGEVMVRREGEGMVRREKGW